MKKIIQLFFLIIIFSLSSCRETKNHSPEKQIDTKSIVEPIEFENQDTVVKKAEKQIKKPKIYEYYYVSAKSGLNYHESPKGSILGKFHLNTRLKVIEKTEIIEKFVNEGKILQGKWLGVEKEKDTVYVYDKFLSKDFIYSDLTIFSLSSYPINDNKSIENIINIGAAGNDYHVKSNFPKIPNNKLGQDTIKLSEKYKRKYLKEIDIENTDKVFIYNFSLDTIFKFEVKNLNLIATLNAYALGDDERSKIESEYDIGIDLSKKYNSTGVPFIYIGKKNVFQTGHLHSLVWEEIDSVPHFIKQEIGLKTFYFKANNFEYYLKTQNAKKGNRHLIIFDKISNSIVFDKHYFESESSSSSELYLKGITYEYSPPRQWTGQIFMNKPPIIYNFFNYYYDCTKIEFIGEPPIIISCTNRD